MPKARRRPSNIEATSNNLKREKKLVSKFKSALDNHKQDNRVSHQQKDQKLVSSPDTQQNEECKRNQTSHSLRDKLFYQTTSSSLNTKGLLHKSRQKHAPVRITSAIIGFKSISPKKKTKNMTSLQSVFKQSSNGLSKSPSAQRLSEQIPFCLLQASKNTSFDLLGEKTLRRKVYELETSLKQERNKNFLVTQQLETIKKKHKKLYSSLDEMRNLDFDDFLNYQEKNKSLTKDNLELRIDLERL